MANPQKKLLVRSQEADPERAPSAPQEKSQIQKDLWRIEDVLAGLSVNKENYRVLVGSVKNPGKTASHLPGIGHGGAGGMACALRQSRFHPCVVSACTLRKKNGAFVPSPICAFTLSN